MTYPCPLCSNQFSNINFFIGHFKLNHGLQQKSTLSCPIENCRRNFNDIYGYKKHLLTKHTSKECSVTNHCSKDTESIHTESIPESSNDLNANVDAEKISMSPAVEPCISLSEFANIISDATAIFVSKLYGNTSMTRALAQEVIQDVTELYGSTCYELLKKRNNCPECPDPRSDLNTMLELIQSSLKTFSTEHEALKHLSNSKNLIVAESICVGATLQPRRNSTEMNIGVVNSNLQIVPMKLLLKTFLELPNVLESTLARLEHLRKSDEITSIVQGKRWKAIEHQFDSKIVLPLIVYFDDFEINNPLGSHKGVHKLGAVYCSIACFPKEYQSKIENILLVQLHHTKDQEKYGNKTIFANLVDQITQLETHGIRTVIDGKETTIYFVLSLIIGDNLGLNSIFGFTTSFNSQYCCRICLADKETLHQQVTEDVDLLRTIENYNTDLAECSRGVKEECIFNNIPFYHVISNSSADPGHDIDEGVFRYDMAKILDKLIYKEKVFSLETLNERIRLFDFNTRIVKNTPPLIKGEALKSGYLVMSASEMCCLVQYLGLIVGDLVRSDNEAWELYIILREINCIIVAPIVTTEGCQLLRTLIAEHHHLYIKIFRENLKPKHHFLNHYPRLMEAIGPMGNISCMRYEAKHRDFKNNAKVSTSRVNPAYTLALKHQLKVAHRFMNRKGFDERLSYGGILQTALKNDKQFRNFQAALPTNFDPKCMITTWAEVNGTMYEPDMILLVGDDDSGLLFGKVQCVLVDTARQVHFLFLKLRNLGLIQHVHAFQVIETKNWGFIPQTQLVTHLPYSMHVMTDGKYYVPCL